MPLTFYGKWSLTIVRNAGEFEERVRIVGSTASDGTVSGAVGTRVAEIDGHAWDIFMERSSDGGATWHLNFIQRIPSVTPQDGLIVTVFADDALVAPKDSDFAVQFNYLNRQVNPSGPARPPFGFTLPPGSFWPPRPAPKELDCCCCCGERRCCRRRGKIAKRRCKG